MTADYTLVRPTDRYGEELRHGKLRASGGETATGGVATLVGGDRTAFRSLD